MGSGMSKILPGLYIGNFRDAKDREQLTANNITHILSIHDNAKKILDDKEYLTIIASDSASENLIQYFPQCIEFIHNARLSGGGVVVHCLAGVSRSVTITAAYLMTDTTLGWREALNAIRGARNHANPNFGFQKQLQTYENEGLSEARRQFKEKYPEDKFNDEADCRQLLQCYKHYVLTGESMSQASSSSAPRNQQDGLYPLPHNAYSTKRHSTLSPDSALHAHPQSCYPSQSAVSDPHGTEEEASESNPVK
ncbi:dual specificity protein phosphatase 22-B-like [Babylonia areolata]|uniref:dual specificity protein phosphatase 22-B-like n=1 Tax=Babylonia areolata TaxID=304850 RepID=UPI003FD3DC76